MLRLSPLAREITAILLMKIALLFSIWWIFFSEPVAHHMKLEPDWVGQHLLQQPPSVGTPHAQR